MTDTEKLTADLRGAPQTTLATLYAKALDADFADSVLNDTYAKDIVERLDYDWTQTTITPGTAPAVTTRSAQFDAWVRQFLAVHPRAVVLHLGCGLDSRFFRIEPGAEVEWYDVDFPDVARLREQLYPARDHYHVIAAPVTDPDWLRAVPADRPALMIAEGLTMYLTEQDGTSLLRRVVDRFPSGELQFDAFNKVAIKGQRINTVVTRAGATLHWAIDRPDRILEAVPGLRLLAWMSPFDDPGLADIARHYRVMAAVTRPVPALRYMAQYHRYAF